MTESHKPKIEDLISEYGLDTVVDEIIRRAKQAKDKSVVDKVKQEMKPEPYVATALIATPESDARIRAEYRTKGEDAYKAGEDRDSGPSGGKIRSWWLEGYDAHLG